jgi:hypothetical protein
MSERPLDEELIAERVHALEQAGGAIGCRRPATNGGSPFDTGKSA